MAGLVLAAAVLLVVLLGVAREKPTARSSADRAVAPLGTLPNTSGPTLKAESPSRPTVPQPLPPAAVTPDLGTVDLFTSDAPELISRAREVTNRGAPLNGDRLKELYQFGKDHPGDARPHLLMGADSMNRQWYGFAVDHYVRAQKEDPRARQDPRMLRDLVQVAGYEHYTSQAAGALRDIYGPSGVNAVEDAIAEAGSKGDLGRVERLTACARLLAVPSAPR